MGRSGGGRGGRGRGGERGGGKDEEKVKIRLYHLCIYTVHLLVGELEKIERRGMRKRQERDGRIYKRWREG